MSNKNASDLQQALKGLNDEQIKKMVTLLATIYENKPRPTSNAPAVAPPPLTDLLYKLAAIHTDTVKRLAVLTDTHAIQMVHYMKERKKAQTTSAANQAAHPVRALAVINIVQGAGGTSNKFFIRNKSDQKRTFEMQDVLEFQRLKSDDSSTIFLSVESDPRIIEIPAANGSEAGRKECSIAIGSDFRLEPGRYRAITHLGQGDAAEVELIIELVVSPKAAEA